LVTPADSSHAAPSPPSSSVKHDLSDLERDEKEARKQGISLQEHLTVVSEAALEEHMKQLMEEQKAVEEAADEENEDEDMLGEEGEEESEKEEDEEVQVDQVDQVEECAMEEPSDPEPGSNSSDTSSETVSSSTSEEEEESTAAAADLVEKNAEAQKANSIST